MLFWTSTLALSALAAWIIFVGAPLLTRRLIYKPEPGAHDFVAPKFPSEIDHEDIFFDTADGERLHGWVARREDSKGLMLICHGNRGSIAGREDTVSFYLQFGMAVCLFDYRGYGKSSGKPSEAGTYRDVDAAWNYLTHERGYARTSIVLLGRSLGAAIAAHLASHETPRAVILESTFSSLADIAGELYPTLKTLFSIHVKYNTREKIPKITSPLLLVHSTTDELIGIHHCRELLAVAAQGTELVEISGRHRDGFVTSEAVYVPAVRQFLEEHSE